MKLTPEQEADIARQKAANPGTRHFRFTPTPEQAAKLRAAAEESELPRGEVAEDYRKLVKAAEEEGFSGWLRRAIRRADRPADTIAEEAGIDFDQLCDFRMGDATLRLTLVEEPAR